MKPVTICKTITCHVSVPPNVLPYRFGYLITLQIWDTKWAFRSFFALKDLIGHLFIILFFVVYQSGSFVFLNALQRKK